MQWKRAIDLSVLLEPPSQASLARLTKASIGKGIDLEGTCGFLWGDYPMLHVLASQERARDLIEDDGFDVRAEQEVLVLESSEPQQLLATVTTCLTEANVQLDLLYMTRGGGLVIGVDDVHRAETALSEWNQRPST
jgi:hypothetical protein